LAKLDVPGLIHEVEQKKAREALAQAGIDQAKRGVDIVEAGLTLVKARGQEAQAGLTRSKAEYDFAKNRYEERRRLANQKVVSAQELEEVAHQFNVARAGVELAEAKLKQMESVQAEAVAKREKALADVKAAEALLLIAKADTRGTEAKLQLAEIRAPFEGVIIRRNANIGEAVGPAGGKDAPLFTLAQLDRVRIVFHVPEKEVSSVAVGAPVKVKVSGIERPIEAKVSRLGAALDSKKHTLPVEVELPNPNRKLMPGLSATVTIRLEKE
jgi:multidrug resistance efflux pump